jgi:hypothetical protein
MGEAWEIDLAEEGVNSDKIPPGVVEEGDSD